MFLRDVDNERVLERGSPDENSAEHFFTRTEGYFDFLFHATEFHTGFYDISVLGSSGTGSNGCFSDKRCYDMHPFIMVVNVDDNIEFNLTIFSLNDVFGMDTTGTGAGIYFGDELGYAPVRKSDPF